MPNERIRVRILVKAFPQPSKKHEETVCCAGVTEDGARLLRLFPIRYRRLAKEHQFERFDLVEMVATKAPSDSRPESYRVDEPSIRLLERSSLTDEAKVRLWTPFIAPSLKELHEDNRATNRIGSRANVVASVYQADLRSALAAQPKRFFASSTASSHSSSLNDQGVRDGLG